jgi:hypothetical protein
MVARAAPQEKTGLVPGITGAYRGPSFETARCAGLLRMRFFLLQQAQPHAEEREARLEAWATSETHFTESGY